MTIRETVADAINQGHAAEAAIRQHERGHQSLLVYPDGTITWAAYVSDNEWRVLPDTSTPVAALININNSIPCNCDACTNGDDPREWAADEAGEMETHLAEQLDKIDDGYFDDEQDEA